MDSSEDPPEPGFLVLDGPREVGTFTFRWPDATEEFDRGWDLVAELNGRRLKVRHALAVRPAFGAERRRCVTFIDGAAVSEGVGADDYDSSRCLLSTLKSSDGKLVRPGEPVPVPFADFPLVVFSDDIDGPYTRHALAVRLHEDDITSWVGYALARQQVRREVAKPAASAQKAVPRLVVEPTPTSASTRAVIDALLDYGRTQAASDIGRPTFTPHPEANDLVIRDPFAFLLAVVFDQGIPAERAWRAPFELMKRLGHLAPDRMAVDPEGVRAAVAQPPVLHRYREKMPRWLVETARIVRDDYEGDAARIWGDEPTARELQGRLDRFPGVGQKKAAMAVEILERDLGVVVRDLHGSDVAYDVHVRRVFLRTGLAEYDDLDHMLEVARRAHPERPGAIDFPAWLVGRQWCGAGVPACPACVLNHVCPKDIGRANVVRGA